VTKWYPGRRFSWLRLIVLLVVCGGLVGGSIWAVDRFQDRAMAEQRGPWVAGYVDVTATPSFPFEQVEPSREGQERSNNVVLAFIVGDADDGCRPSWGGHYTLDEAASELDLDRRIVRLRDQGGDTMVSFGGQANSDIALGCEDADGVRSAYGEVLDRYRIDAIDLDLEGEMLQTPAAIERQAEAVEALQKQRASEGGLDVWLTLPVTPTGLDKHGVEAVRAYLKAGVSLQGVNAMTMDFNSAKDLSMRERVQSSLEGLHDQLRSLYAEVDESLGSATAWSMVAATPMIGQNDVPSEVFSLRDAHALNGFANDHGMARLSYWSANRDRECDANWPDLRRVSTSCSGVWQGDATFADALSEGRTGDLSQSDVKRPEPDPQTGPIVDDPKTSPYPIWNVAAAYPAATKVVWKRNVYEAKWWTQGEQPDEALYDSTVSSWRLIGPVLEGETPIVRPQVPKGTYPEWNPNTVYKRGTRIMLGADAYEAKWWSRGDSPDASLVLPQESPWRLLSDAEIREVIGQPEPGSNDGTE